MFMCISLVYVNGLCVFSSTQKYRSSFSRVLQIYVGSLTERQGIHKVGMYDCGWKGVNNYYSNTHEIISLWLQDKSSKVFQILVIAWCIGLHSAVGLKQLHSVACVLNRFKDQEGGDLLQHYHLQITNTSSMWSWELESWSHDNVQQNLSITKSSDHSWKCTKVFLWVTKEDP